VPVLLVSHGKRITGCHADRATAKKLARHLFEPVRLFGKGQWSRGTNGTWIVDRFSIEHFEPLDDAPLSEAARFHVDRGNATLEDLAAGGDDYELLFSIPKRAVPQATEIAAACGVALTVIGEVTDGPGVSAFTTDGESPGSATGGYVHSWNGPAD